MTTVRCEVHADVETDRRCAECKKAVCDACAVYEIDGDDGCDSCGRVEDAKSRTVGTTLLALVGLSYLVAVAVGVVLFKPRPFVGGMAAVFSIAMRYTLQTWLRPRAVIRRQPA